MLENCEKVHSYSSRLFPYLARVKTANYGMGPLKESHLNEK